MRLVREANSFYSKAIDFYDVVNKLYMGKVYFGNRYYFRNYKINIVKKNTFNYNYSYWL